MKIERASQEIASRLSRYVYGVEDEELEFVVLRNLAHYRWTLAVADCSSAGWLGRALGSLEAAYPGIATVLSGTEATIARVIGADLDDETHQYRVGRLAAALREELRVKYALATEPLPEMSLEELVQSRLRVRVAVAGPDGILVDSLPVGGNPAILHARIGKTALDLLRRELPSRLS